MFLKNAWYVAAWEREAQQDLTPVTLLGRRLVLFKSDNGEFAALDDVCPHRKLPLSMGRLRDGMVECGYHGLTFDRTGACRKAPAVESIPPKASIRSYRVVSRYGLLWIWMGQSDLADPSKIMAVEHWDEPGWSTGEGGSMQVDCHYLHVTDNLLDPSHVAWVHATSFGNVACADAPAEIVSSEDGITVSRWMRDVEIAPFYRHFVRFTGKSDRRQHYEVRYPSHAVIKAEFVPAGGSGSERPSSAFLMDSYNFLTPVDEGHTRYFWFQQWNSPLDDPGLAQQLQNSVRQAFEEDRLILNAVQRGSDYDSAPRLWLKIDSGPQRFRTRLQQLIDSEAR